MLFVNCFFFQAEDGIRAATVTGVQTCALPISGRRECSRSERSIPRAGTRAGSRRARQPEIGRASCRERVEISVVAEPMKKRRRAMWTHYSERRSRRKTRKEARVHSQTRRGVGV